MIWLFLLVWTALSCWYLSHQMGNKHSTIREPWWSWVLAFPMLVVAFLYGIVSNPKDAWKYYKNKFNEYYK